MPWSPAPAASPHASCFLLQTPVALQLRACFQPAQWQGVEGWKCWQLVPPGSPQPVWKGVESSCPNKLALGGETEMRVPPVAQSPVGPSLAAEAQDSGKRSLLPSLASRPSSASWCRSIPGWGSASRRTRTNTDAIALFCPCCFHLTLYFRAFHVSA